MNTISTESLCNLCGYRIGQHVVPPYNTPSQERGPTGLWCPSDVRLTNPKPVLDADSTKAQRATS